jgi:pyrimidine deaminase RibD-like protein
LSLAAQAIALSDPNPRVGCVITAADGQVLGQGHTQQAGGPHAEVMALREAAEKGHSVQGATAWVTLEPCAHHGRTPPCADALVVAGLARVVVALADPNPLVAGQGSIISVQAPFNNSGGFIDQGVGGYILSFQPSGMPFGLAGGTFNVYPNDADKTTRKLMAVQVVIANTGRTSVGKIKP